MNSGKGELMELDLRNIIGGEEDDMGLSEDEFIGEELTDEEICRLLKEGIRLDNNI